MIGRLLFLIAFFYLDFATPKGTNVNVIGFVEDSMSLSRHTTTVIDCLAPTHNITLYKTRFFEESNPYFNRVSSIVRFRRTAVLRGVSLFTDNLFIYGAPPEYNPWGIYKYYVNDLSTIKFVYAVAEQEVISPDVVSVINTNFHALLVPDVWLVQIFKNAGVSVPIFVMPLALDLSSLLARPLDKKKSGKQFIFGFSGAFWHHKNHKLLLEAFRQEFGNDPSVELHLHGRFGHGEKDVVAFVKEVALSNVTLINEILSRADYENFLASLDCFVTVSGGEGFSIIPREAMAAGVPCIVSNNSAHETICKSGLVLPIPSYKTLPTCCELCPQKSGYMYSCSIQDIRKAMRFMYENYESFEGKREEARAWAAYYTVKNLSKRYQTLVSPKKVLLGDRDDIDGDTVITQSKKLFDAYTTLMRSL